MARFNISPELLKYQKQLMELNVKTRQYLIGQAVYKGAGIVADAVRENIEGLKESDSSRLGVTQKQKQGLLRGLGISKMKVEEGYANVKIGFKGYNKHVSNTYPKGQPNAMIARSLEKGTSYAPGQPFVRPAVRRTKAAAENAMKDVIESGIEKIMS